MRNVHDHDPYTQIQKMENETNFSSHLTKIENVLRSCQTFNLIIEGEKNYIKVFDFIKTCTPILHATKDQLNKIQKNLIWSDNRPNINWKYSLAIIKMINICIIYHTLYMLYVYIIY